MTAAGSFSCFFFPGSVSSLVFSPSFSSFEKFLLTPEQRGKHRLAEGALPAEMSQIPPSPAATSATPPCAQLGACPEASPAPLETGSGPEQQETSGRLFLPEPPEPLYTNTPTPRRRFAPTHGAFIPRRKKMGNPEC